MALRVVAPEAPYRSPLGGKVVTEAVWLAWLRDLIEGLNRVEQSVAFNGALFTGSVGNWGVFLASQVYLRYRIGDGRRLRFRGQILNTDVAGTPPGNELRVTLPEGLTWGTTDTIGILRYRDAVAGPGWTLGVAIARANQTYVALMKATEANWTATGGQNTSVEFDVDAEVASIL